MNHFIYLNFNQRKKLIMVLNEVSQIKPASDSARSEKVKIRPMEFRDLDRVSELEKRIFRAPWPRRSFALELENSYSRSLVLEFQGRVVGYAVYWLIDGEAHLANIAIDADYRGMGLGETLLRFILQELKLRKVKKIHLEVRKSNVVAQNLYFKFGFKITGIRKNYYTKDREDALLMSLSLKEG